MDSVSFVICGIYVRYKRVFYFFAFWTWTSLENWFPGLLHSNAFQGSSEVIDLQSVGENVLEFKESITVFKYDWNVIVLCRFYVELMVAIHFSGFQNIFFSLKSPLWK